MRWSFKVGKIFGIEFRIHVTFFALLFFVYLAGLRMPGGGPNAAWTGVLFISAVFVCVVIHEIGHSLIARRFGKEAKSITLLPIGGVATMEEMPDKPGQEILMALVGPWINLAIAGILYAAAAGRVGLTWPVSLFAQSGKEFLSGFITVNLAERVAMSAVGAMLQDSFEKLTPEVVDGVGEMTNIISGGIKKRLTGTSWSFSHVTVPSVIIGHNYHIAYAGGLQFLSVTFEHVNENALMLDDRLMKVAVSLIRL